MGSRTTDLRHSWSGWSGHAYLRFGYAIVKQKQKLHYDMENEVWVQVREGMGSSLEYDGFTAIFPSSEVLQNFGCRPAEDLEHLAAVAGSPLLRQFDFQIVGGNLDYIGAIGDLGLSSFGWAMHMSSHHWTGRRPRGEAWARPIGWWRLPDDLERRHISHNRGTLRDILLRGTTVPIGAKT